MKRAVFVLLFCAFVLSMNMVAHAEVVVGVAPGKNESPKCEALDEVMSGDLQNYIFGLCQDRYPDDEQKQKEYYAALIGLAEGESTFNPDAYNGKNKNGTVDRGMYQINSSNVKNLKKAGLISSSEDLYDPKTAASCGDYMYSIGFDKYGFSRRSYDEYLYADGKAHDNKYTRRVWNMQQSWYEKIWEGNDDDNCNSSTALRSVHSDLRSVGQARQPY